MSLEHIPDEARILNFRRLLGKAKRKIEKAKAQVCAKVEHPFRVVKRQFGYVKNSLGKLGLFSPLGLDLT